MPQSLVCFQFDSIQYNHGKSNLKFEILTPCVSEIPAQHISTCVADIHRLFMIFIFPFEANKRNSIKEITFKSIKGESIK